MDEENEPQRIEIELTPLDSSSIRRAHTAPVDATDDDEPGRSDLFGSERARLVAVGAVAALAALVIGMFVGRLGAGDVATSDGAAPTTTGAPAPTTQAVDPNTLPLAPRVPLVSTTVAEVAVATVPIDPDQPVEGTMTVHPFAASAGAEVVALTIASDVVRIDTATGRTITTAVNGAQGGPSSIFAGDEWILVRSFDGLHGSTVLYDDGTRSSLELGDFWPVLVDVDSATLWRPEGPDPAGLLTRFVEQTIDGTPTGATIDVRGFYPQMADPLGGVVVQAPGGFYRLMPEGATRLTTGQLVALGRQRALVNECGESLECAYTVVDRETGSRTALVLDPALDVTTLDGGGWWAFRESVSPTGDAALVTFWDQTGGGSQEFGVIDLTTGAYQEIGTSMDVAWMEWSPDGHSVYWLDGGRLTVFDRSAGRSERFSDDLGTLTAFTVRPAAPSLDGTSSSLLRQDVD